MTSILLNSFKTLELANITPLCKVVLDKGKSNASLESMICGDCGGDCPCDDYE